MLEIKEGLKMDFNRDVAVADFCKRKEENNKRERVNNSSLWAGAPMYYYCRYCGAVDIKPENFDPCCNPVKDPCEKCKELLANGGIPE